MPKPTRTASFSLPLATLRKLLHIASTATDRRPLAPELGAVRIACDQAGVEVAATNTRLTVRAQQAIAGDVQPGALHIPHARIDGYVRWLDGKTAHLSGNTRNVALLRCGRSETRLAMLEPDKFPELAPHACRTSLTLESAVVGRMLEHTHFAIDSAVKGDTKLRGALLEVVGGQAHMVTTDGHRLARYTVGTSAADCSMFLPAELLAAAAVAIGTQDEGHCSFGHSEDGACSLLTGDGCSVGLSHTPVEARFPRYRGIIPDAAEAVVTVGVSELTHAVRRCMAIDDGAASVISIEAKPGELLLHATNTVAGETTELVSGESASAFASTRAFFRGSYIMDVLQRTRGSVEVRFALVGGEAGLWIKFTAAVGETFEYVLMSIRNRVQA